MNEDQVKNDEDNEKKFKQLMLTSQMLIMSELSIILQNVTQPDNKYLRLLEKSSETNEILLNKMETYLNNIK
jgi:hypothetical protein